MEIFSVLSIGVAAAFISLVIKKDRPEFAVYIALAAGLVILLSVLPVLRDVMDFLTEITALGGIAGDLVKQALKISCVGWLCAIASGLCRDAQEGALAGTMELAGKIIILAMTLPIFRTLIEIVTSMVEANV